jgi:hypothetical protein
MGREVEATLVAVPARAATARVPRSTSAPSKAVFVERKKRVAVGGAAPPPRFRVVSVTVIAEPAVVVAGTVRALTVRSGPMETESARVLLASFASGTRPSPSARATM